MNECIAFSYAGSPVQKGNEELRVRLAEVEKETEELRMVKQQLTAETERLRQEVEDQKVAVTDVSRTRAQEQELSRRTTARHVKQ
ncbi:hypothetical protein FHG87_025183, partial [Trinorchestia longiramus]